ncbi:DUF3566 domain-containing protein [Actinomarinicola tropica]|uniref:DUF3566 domain-containing protein n=1 Tax=Actinomarinicola tropica TaxID=2789776 RepID=A0A5Q2R9W0_9ACTN|nr:DUF3566 domain-containing protein [Actinomarinicola tropica]QGG93628.1 hypothetical protein GH723_00040 [Actinomarinicola tropica]
MSDRSGVGAPTHDGAEPGATGSEEPAEETSAAPRRRRAAGLLEAAFGAEPAAGRTPPGVPSGPTAGDAASAPAKKTPAKKAPAKKASATKASARKAPATKASAATASANTAPAAAAAASAPAAAVRSGDRTVERPAATAAAAPTAAARPARPAVADDRGRRRGPLRARQVHRVIRRVDPWSMLKLSLVFWFCVWLMVMISGVLIWGVAVGSGTVEGVEGFIARLLAFEEFTFNADQIFRLFAMGGLILVFLATAVSAILAVLFNLISDLIGGIRITVIEEETTRRVVRER